MLGNVSATIMERLIQKVRDYQQAKLTGRLVLAEEIITEVGPAIKAHVLKTYRGSKEQAEDIFQEILVAIAKGLEDFRGRKDQQFWEWCYVISRNRTHDQLRKEKRMPVASVNAKELWEVIEIAAKDQPLSAGERLDLEYVIGLLSVVKPPCVDYLWSHYVLGFSYGAIGEKDGLSEDAARIRVQRCVKLAQNLLAGET